MGHRMYQLNEAEDVFTLLQGALERTKVPIAIVSIRPLTEGVTYTDEEIVAFSRSSDIVFRDGQSDGWWTVLPNSGKKEIYAFLDRLYTYFSPDRSLSFQACYTEVRDNQTPLMNVITSIHCEPVPQQGMMIEFVNGPWTLAPKQLVKVSVVVNEPILREVLMRSLSVMAFEHFEIDIAVYEDGLAFEEEKSYTSSHPHLVILEDVLPKKNGIELVHFLRNQPSSGKFHIFMLTDRVSEENVISAYHTGIDNVLQKPFNLRLFEAMFRRTIERLWVD